MPPPDDPTPDSTENVEEDFIRFADEDTASGQQLSPSAVQALLHQVTGSGMGQVPLHQQTAPFLAQPQSYQHISSSAVQALLDQVTGSDMGQRPLHQQAALGTVQELHHQRRDSFLAQPQAHRQTASGTAPAPAHQQQPQGVQAEYRPKHRGNRAGQHTADYNERVRRQALHQRQSIQSKGHEQTQPQPSHSASSTTGRLYQMHPSLGPGMHPSPGPGRRPSPGPGRRPSPVPARIWTHADQAEDDQDREYLRLRTRDIQQYTQNIESANQYANPEIQRANQAIRYANADIQHATDRMDARRRGQRQQDDIHQYQNDPGRHWDDDRGGSSYRDYRPRSRSPRRGR